MPEMPDGGWVLDEDASDPDVIDPDDVLDSGDVTEDPEKGVV